MLELKNINKSYKTGDFVQQALKDVSIKFRKNEFVAILGASGSGKTTLLNIIGGLDKYDSGDLIIDSESTKKFKREQWDSYRNNCIGFIFQSYNLIPHISILDNTMMGMTLSGVSYKKRVSRAREVLKKVGLLEHAHKRPNELSGGQMQRVAIARALVNDPDIILADEPTGALDTKTSVQIMDLIKEISKDKLVIMVTHNPDLARTYATRIIEFQDGVKLSDSNPISELDNAQDKLEIRKTSMSFVTALKLSFNNIKTKKGRTLLTAFASSIGIIGIALILALSNGFKIEVDEFERNSLSQAPIIISSQAMNMSEDLISNIQGDGNLEEYTSKKEVYVTDDIVDTMLHTNVISSEYLDYLEGLDKTLLAGVSYVSATGINVINDGVNGKTLVDTSMWQLLPTNPNEGEDGIIANNYDVLAGKINEDEPGIILLVDRMNRIYKSTLNSLGLSGEKVSFDDILNAKFKVILNDSYYVKYGSAFIPSQDLDSLYDNSSIVLPVQAIVRSKEDKEVISGGSGIIYTNELTELIVSNNKDSEIVKAQRESDYNVLTNKAFDNDSMSTNTKEIMLSYLGDQSVPQVIYLYPKDFDSKESVTSFLDKYNKGKSEKDVVEYTDMAEMISSLSGNIMDAITVVLIAFSSISLVVSSIMIAIITYISVLERTKEIGILRALGARKKDIKRVFNAETFLIGLTSGFLGIGIAYLLTIPVNIIIENLSGLANVSKLNIVHALILVLINVVLTILGGYIPAGIASKKDPVVALRTE